MLSPPKPPHHLVKEHAARKAKNLQWFHYVTSTLNDEQVLALCAEKGIAIEGLSTEQQRGALLQSVDF